MICEKCKGFGTFLYPNTSTWRNGSYVVLWAMTEDTCDECWGSGDIDKPGVNLIEKEEVDKIFSKKLT